MQIKKLKMMILLKQLKKIDDFNFFKEDSFINKYLLDKTVIDSSNNILEMYNYTYSVTFWVNINPQPPSTGHLTTQRSFHPSLLNIDLATDGHTANRFFIRPPSGQWADAPPTT